MKSLNETLWNDSFSGQVIDSEKCCIKISIGISAVPDDDITNDYIK